MATTVSDPSLTDASMILGGSSDHQVGYLIWVSSYGYQYVEQPSSDHTTANHSALGSIYAD